MITPPLGRPAAFFLATLALAAPTRAQILGDFEAEDRFGSTLAAGDFDGNGFADLAVAAPYESVGDVASAGAVNVIYSGAAGLDVPGNQFWHQDSDGITGLAQATDYFGTALAAGDFDGDGYDDLAIGIPNEELVRYENIGAVCVLYGSAAGLTADRDQLWTQNSPGVESDIGYFEFFGGALAAADFNGDGFADLAVGVHGERVTFTLFQAGAVNVLYGSATGLTADGDQFWHQNSPDVPDDAESDDVFGSALAGGDFDGDGYDDLAVGAEGEDGAGAIFVLYGSANGLTATSLATASNRLFRQGTGGVLDEPEDGDLFGASLASGDFDGDGFGDLAVGAPGENLASAVDGGAVHVLYGTAAGLRTPDNQLWHQSQPNVLDSAENDDRFGSSLTAGDFDGDGFDDLAVGVPGETLGAIDSTGALHALYGTAVGLTALDNQFWHQDSPDITGDAEVGDVFGTAVAAGDFDGDGFDDLAAGVPQEDLSGLADAGALHALYGAAGPGLTASGDQLWRQGATSLLADAETDAAAAAVTEQPAAFALDAPYPNPARTGAVMLGFTLPEAGHVRLAVYDVLGREVVLLADGAFEAGRHAATLDGSRLPSGTYLVRLEVGDPARGAGGRVLARPLTVLR
jgi:hypothetical protein